MSSAVQCDPHFLLPKLTTMNQPMDQGVTVVTKKLYQQRFLNEVMAMYKDKEKGNQGALMWTVLYLDSTWASLEGMLEGSLSK